MIWSNTFGVNKFLSQSASNNTEPVNLSCINNLISTFQEYDLSYMQWLQENRRIFKLRFKFMGNSF